MPDTETPQSGETSQGGETTPHRHRFGQRKHIVLAGLTLSIAALILITQTWITVGAPDTGVAVESLNVAGGTATPAAPALAVVMLAATIALTIAGPVTRWIITVVQALAGAGVAGVSIWAALSPEDAASAKVGETFGLGVVSSVYEVTIFPIITAVAGILMVLVAVWGVFVSAPAASTSSKYDRASSKTGSATSKPGNRPAGQSAGNDGAQDDTAVDEAMDEIDQWDALTQGDDPTDPDGPRSGRARFY